MSGRAASGLLVVLTAAGAVCAQATRPAGDGDAGSAAAALLETGRSLLRSDPSAAMAALRRAVEADPNGAEARYLLGRACQACGRNEEAVAAYRWVVGRLGPDDPPTPAEKHWLTDARKRLAALAMYPKRWAALRAEHAGRFRKLAAGHGGMPSCLRALEAAAALDGEDEKLHAELEAARSLIEAVLPAPAAKPDAEGAALLVRRAGVLLRQGKRDEGIKLLRNACGMARELKTLVLLARACFAAGRLGEAAVAAEAARELLGQAPNAVRNATAGPLADLIRRADPNSARVEAALGAFAAAAEALAAAAARDEDIATARAVLVKVLELLPERASARKRLAALGGDVPGGNCPIDLRASWIVCRCPLGRECVRTRRDGVELQWRTDAKRTGGTVEVCFTRLRWGRSVRARWRIELLSPPPGLERRLGAWQLPLDGYLQASSIQARWGCGFSGKDNCRVVRECDPAVLRRLYREGAWRHEVGFEKAGGRLTVTLDGETIREVQITPKGATRGSMRRPITFRLKTHGLPADQDAHLRATLLEFQCSRDCLQPGR